MTDKVVMHKRYWSRSQVDGRRLGLVVMYKFESGRIVTFERETEAERRRWKNAGALSGKRYTVCNQFMCVRYTDDFAEALRAFIVSVHGGG